MKLLIGLLLLTLSTVTFAGHKVERYFAVGPNLHWNSTTTTTNGVDTKSSSFGFGVSNGYIFNKHWDLFVGLNYGQSSGSDAKTYGGKVGVKYIFNKRPGLIKHHHKTWMTPYVGVSYDATRMSPQELEDDEVAKTTNSGYAVSVGVRCFMRANLGVAWDLSYHVSDKVQTNKTSGAEISNLKTKQIVPSISFFYFY